MTIWSYDFPATLKSSSSGKGFVGIDAVSGRS